MSANFKRASNFTLSQAGVLTSLSAYLDGNGGAGGFQNIRLVLYKDVAGTPGDKVVDSNIVSVAAGMVPQWVRFATPETQLAAGTYWIAILTDVNAGVARNYGDTNGTGSWYGNSDSFSGGGSVSFGSGTSSNTTLSVYASYVPGTLKLFGRNTVASSTSAGMSANFKRGSWFTLSETGTVTSFSAYLDGNGGGSGPQDVRVALYQDANGVPGNLIAQSSTVTVTSGMVPQWVNFPVPPTSVLPAGKYWMVLQTGGYTGALAPGANNPGVARNYGDTSGTGGWYGNSDMFWDGASNPFGTGTSGSTTLSVYASYVH
jgi:hypothetical protein